MRIESVRAAFPSRVVTNDEVIALIKEQSTGYPTHGLERVLRAIRRGLSLTGAETRRWCSPVETPREITLEACRLALGSPDRMGRVDCIIYASVYPFLTEPSSANYIAHELGLDDVECFDIKEACDGWMKAMKIAYALIMGGGYRRIMIVNAEFSMDPGFALFPKLFQLEGSAQIEYRFPGYTIGECATATIVGRGDGMDRQWAFTNITRNDLYDLCTVTPSWYGAHPCESARVGKDGPGCFTSYGADLYRHGFPLSIDLFKRSGIDPKMVDAFFTHSSSKKDWTEVAETLGLVPVFHDIYAEYGNVVSAAIPAALALAVEKEMLKRGDRVAALVASAGMSFSTASFVY